MIPPKIYLGAFRLQRRICLVAGAFEESVKTVNFSVFKNLSQEPKPYVFSMRLQHDGSLVLKRDLWKSDFVAS